MKILGVIPSRYASSRFPGKPLADILGVSMIQRVYEQAKRCKTLDTVIVATDDDRIYQHVKDFGGEVIMTAKEHPSGTDRCNEVVQKLNPLYDIVVNIQGDEPYINPKQIDQVVQLFTDEKVNIGTLAKKIEDKGLLKDENSPKVILTIDGFASNFCRLIKEEDIKHDYYKHIGIYAFRTQTLAELCKLATSKNEITERLEQLRWLDSKYLIKVGITTHEGISVDSPKDIDKIKAQLR